MNERGHDGQGGAGPPTRRRLLRGAAATAVATVLAGCGAVTSYEFSAEPVGLPAATRRQLAYGAGDRETVTTERTRTVGGVEVRATVESYVVTYGTGPDQPASHAVPTIGAASTPPARVMGRSFNPLARQSLANLLASETGTGFLRRAGLDAVGHRRRRVRWTRGPQFIAGREGACLGRNTTLESYAGVLGGDPPSAAFVHLTRVQPDDAVLVAAVHGHDVEDPGRAFVGPDSGYLTPDEFDTAVALFGEVTGALRYGESAATSG